MFVWICVAGEIGCSNETGISSAQTDTAAADNDAGEDQDTSEAKVKLKVAETDTRDSGHEADITERQSAALYVSRLSQFIVTLVNDATSSLDADKLLQEFSSSFCTGITLIRYSTFLVWPG